MSVPAAPDISRRDWTAEGISDLPDDGNRYEVVDGELLVTPAPSEEHQDLAFELAVLLKPYADALQYHLFMAPTAVRFSDRREVQPDVLVLPSVDGKRVRAFRGVRRLTVAIEVVSPSTHRADRYVKRRLYQGEGVSEYWIVDGGMRMVDRWRPGDEEPEIFTEVLHWQPEAGVAPLTIDVRWLFGRVVDDDAKREE